MKDELVRANHFPVLFLDDWPLPSKNGNSDKQENEDDFELPGMNEVKRWRLQMLLAVNTWGIPSLALAEAYKRMFNKELDIKDLGFEDLASMISNLSDIFSIQEPDELTAIMFPQYPHDRILHDARYGHKFDNNRNNSGSSNNNSSSKRNLLLNPSSAQFTSYSKYNSDYDRQTQLDPDTLISYAWLNRDEDLPPNVVLAGEQYSELILPLTSANIPGTRGVHRAVIASAASPDRIFLNIKSHLLERLDQFSNEVAAYFEQCEHPLEMYSIPDEFIYPGFPCLVYSKVNKTWERASILRRSPKGNKVLVETVDFGGDLTVSTIDLFLMPRQFFDFPRQALLVSLAGLMPPDGSNDRRWSHRAGCRIRSFSNLKYWLDCLLLEPKVSPTHPLSSTCIHVNEQANKPNNSEESTSVCSSDSDKIRPKKRKKIQRKAQYEIIACDRNDDELDVFLDSILYLETYATLDPMREKEILTLKEHFKKALVSIPRPENPLK